MKQWPWFIWLPAVLGCINGAPLPATPASSLAVLPTSDSALQKAEYIELAKSYLQTEGKDPMRATFEVHRTLPHEDQTADPDGGPPTAAVVTVDFLNGTIWELEVKTNGDIVRRAGR